MSRRGARAPLPQARGTQSFRGGAREWLVAVAIRAGGEYVLRVGTIFWPPLTPGVAAGAGMDDCARWEQSAHVDSSCRLRCRVPSCSTWALNRP